MLDLKFITAILLLLFSFNTAYPQITKVEKPGTSGIKFKSFIDSQEYILYINLPAGYEKTTKKYPVLYVTDGQWFYDWVLAAYFGQHYDGLVPDLITVGITWTGDYEVNRAFDFTPTRVDNFPHSGNAAKFLSVIKNEIIRYIDSTYRTDKNNRALYGTSLGGIFALYSVFHEPLLFNRYIIVSPSIWWDNEIAFKYEKHFAEQNHLLNTKIFISSGEYEEAVDVTNAFKRFTDQLTASKYKGLSLESIVLEKMSHSGSGLEGAIRGLQYIYGKPEIALDTALLNQYSGHYVLNADTIILSRTGNNLYLDFPGGKARLYAETNSSVYVKGMSTTGEFKRDDKGKVTGYNLITSDTTLFYKRIDK